MAHEILILRAGVVIAFDNGHDRSNCGMGCETLMFTGLPSGAPLRLFEDANGGLLVTMGWFITALRERRIEIEVVELKHGARKYARRHEFDCKEFCKISPKADVCEAIGKNPVERSKKSERLRALAMIRAKSEGTTFTARDLERSLTWKRRTLRNLWIASVN